MTAPTAAIPAVPIRRSDSDAAEALPVWRLNVMRIGYLVMAVGLLFVKWPIFFQGRAASLPIFEGVVAALLATMGVLAFLGLRHPVKLLPLLMLESGWKLLWIGAVAVPHLIAGDMTDEMGTMFGSIAVGLIVVAVTPWDYVWKRYVRAPGDPWR